MSGRKKSAVPSVRGKACSLTFLAGSRSFEFKLPRVVWLAGLLCLPLIGLVFVGATAYWIFHDDLLASLMRRQIDMQYAYEDRIGLLRHEIESVTLRARSEEARFDADLQSLTARQTQAESRTALLLALSERMKAYRLSDPRAADGLDTRPAKPANPGEINPLLTGAYARPLPEGSRAYAPVAPQFPARPEAKPHPEAPDLRGGADTESYNAPPSAPWSVSIEMAPPNPAGRIAYLAAVYDRMDAEHVAVLANLQVPASRFSKDIRTALATAGLGVDEISTAAPARSNAKTAAKNAANSESGLGGPFVPLPVSVDGSAFARQAALLEAALNTSENLRRILPHVPLRQPLSGPLEVTSNFGARIDPFLGRAALHTGVDLLEEYGAAVRATAAGRIVLAGPNGGYGNMVEIDHGNGLTTRYAHLSAILVELDQTVDAGTVVGKVGSTGRSTGAHLHYETRIGGEAVDPERFLRAGALVYATDGFLGCRDTCSQRVGSNDQ
jgi:murein DD-endopeptidase MepM/ murein hydrolase activator NlpD